MRKASLILGIAGTAVMIVGICAAVSDDWFRSASITTAAVGGAVAVTGFYFAFKH